MTADSRMRILMIVENNPYQRDTRVRQEARALADAGHRVAVIAPRAAGRPWHEHIDGISLYTYAPPRPGDGLLGYLWEYGYSLLAAWLLSLVVLVREGFDVIHAANPPDTLVLIGGPYRLVGKRFVYDHHDLAPEMYGARFRGKPNPVMVRALLFFERLSCRLADYVIATNDSYRRLALERGGVLPERVTVVRNGPDVAVLRQVPSHPAVPRDGRTVIGYVGSIGHHDGVDYLLRALYELRISLGRGDFFGVLVGAGDALEDVRALAQDLGLQDRLLFTAWVPHDEVAQYLSATDLCVAPEPSNPYNDRCTVIKMMEYMALGKPIVAFDLPEHRVTAAGAALYAEANSPQDLARAILRLMDDPALRERMGAEGAERVRSQLAWQHQVPALLAAYSRLRERGAFARTGATDRTAGEGPD